VNPRFVNNCIASSPATMVSCLASPGNWRDVGQCELEVGRWYVVRRVYGVVRESPALAEWCVNGWNAACGRLQFTRKSGASIEVWCAVNEPDQSEEKAT